MIFHYSRLHLESSFIQDQKRVQVYGYGNHRLTWTRPESMATEHGANRYTLLITGPVGDELDPQEVQELQDYFGFNRRLLTETTRCEASGDSGTEIISQYSQVF